MNIRLKQFKNPGIFMPLIFIVIISNQFSDNQYGSRLLGFWNLMTLNNDSPRVVGIKKNADDSKSEKLIDQIDQSSRDPNIRTSYQITSPEYFTGTATLPPVPTYTLQFPKITETSQLLYANRDPGESEITKKEQIPFWLSLKRFWPFVLLIVIWFVIGIWYIFSQLIID